MNPLTAQLKPALREIFKFRALSRTISANPANLTNPSNPTIAFDYSSAIA
jgi:hypothetical protein